MSELTQEGGIAQARKDVSQIFNNLLRRQIGTRWPTVEHLSAKEQTIFAALRGCVRVADGMRGALRTES